MKLWYIRMTECHPALKRNELLSHEKTWRHLKCIFPRGRSQSEKDHILQCVQGSNYLTFWKRQNHGDIKKISGWGSWLAQSVEHVTPDVGVVSSSPMLGGEMT